MRSGWASRDLRAFAILHPEVEGVLQRCGRGTYDLVLVDVEGSWTRDVVASAEEGLAVAADLGVRLHHGWADPRLARRIDQRDEWGSPGGTRRAL